MFGLGPATRVFVATGTTDMRKGFDGLYGIVRDQLGADPRSGHVFLFANRTRTRVKLLIWDGTGLWVCAAGAGPVWVAGGESGGDAGGAAAGANGAVAARNRVSGSAFSPGLAASGKCCLSRNSY